MLLDARTGIVARVQAQTPTVFEVRCDGVDVRVTVVDSAAHLRVDAIGRGGEALVTRETNSRSPAR